MPTFTGPLPPHPTGPASARQFVKWCVETVGMGYHPDISFEDYVADGHDFRVFSDADACILNRMTAAAMRQLNDIYGVGLVLMAERFGLTLGEDDGDGPVADVCGDRV